MEKKRYYISIQAGTIVENRGDSAYELEIEATPDQVEQLKEIFEDMDEFNLYSGVRTVTGLSIAYHHDEDNDGYDYYLKQAYALIHDLGTEQTKQHIQKMDILG